MRKNTVRHDHYIMEMRKGLLAWYDFAPGSRVLYVGDAEDPTAELLSGRSGSVIGENGAETGGLSVTVVAFAQSFSEDLCRVQAGTFDYLICIETLETEEHPEAVLEKWRELLKPEGILLLGMNNRFAIRFFCGDRDKYTGRNFDGIENYYRAYMKPEDSFNGRMYDHAELVRMLDRSGFSKHRFYSVMAGLQNPSLLFAYGHMPNEDISNRFYPAYDTPETVFLDEEVLYHSLIDNGMFHQMAGAYLIEAAVSGTAALTDALQITCSAERDRKNAMATIVRERGDVLKKNLYPEGRKRLEEMLVYADDLRGHGLRVIDMELREEGLVMSRIDAPTGQLALKEMLLTDKEAFLKAMDHFHELVMRSSDAVGETQPGGLGPQFQYGYLDLVPLNSFYMDGTFVFFDQEFREENYPAYAVAMRTCMTFYFGNASLARLMPPEELYKRYDLYDYREDWMRMEWRFIERLRNERELDEYHKRVRRDPDTVNSNRQSMNYPAGEYERLFVDIFRNADTRKLILFGSGRFAEKFCDLYAADYPVYAVIDNQEKRWGETLHDVEIQSPELLSRLAIGEYKVIICIKNYLSVMRQLKEMGITGFSIFDPARDYPRKRHPLTEEGRRALGEEQPAETDPEGEAAVRKKYHIGYVSGVFDLYHVGHQNLFRRAKEQCDYLIVGVVSDKGVIKYKGVAPFVPFEERIELVRGCRYVDEAVEIPVDRNGPKDALALYHFDVMFQGSDHMNDDYWIEMKEYLNEHGVDIVFFPYTLSTNSTNLKALIEKKLM